MKTNNETTSEGRILRLKNEEKNFYMIDAENFRITDSLFSHEPQSSEEEELYELMKEATYMVHRNFWVSNIKPGYDSLQRCLIFQEGLDTAHISTRQWDIYAKGYYVERGSRVANRYEKAIISAHLIKKIIEAGVSEKRAWKVVSEANYGSKIYRNDEFEYEKSIMAQYEDLSQLKITFTETNPELWSSMVKILDIGYSFSYCDEAIAIVVLTVPPENT